MKNSIIIVLLIALTQVSFGQTKQLKEVKTSSFRVEGNCDQCKKRIENAAFIKGVKNAVWDQGTQILTITYRIDKTDIMKVQEAVAKAGHTAENVEADSTAYSKLPDCCKYKERKHSK